MFPESFAVDWLRVEAILPVEDHFEVVFVSGAKCCVSNYLGRYLVAEWGKTLKK